MFERLKKLFTRKVKNPETPQREMITRTCKICGKTFTLPENVQHWPDCCQECRAKYRPAGRWRTSPESAGNAGRPSLSRQTPLAGQNIARNAEDALWDLWGSLWTGEEKLTSEVVCTLRIPQDSD